MKNKSFKIVICILSILILTATAVFFCFTDKGSAVLSNENASAQAKQLYNYILSLEGNSVLSAQQESTWMGSADYETDYIFECSGKYPAIKGFDYMNDDFDGVNERAIQWHERGGIVTICWHCGSDFRGEWSDCMNNEVSDWKSMLTEGTGQYSKMIAGMDKAAAALRKLQDKGIPVLWRPFHEFDGHWFWWSKGGSESFKRMWQIMYDRYTNHWKLNNLIWVLGFSDQGEHSKNWYPGDGYCDIIGADTYTQGVFSRLYRKMQRMTTAPKPICLHECGKNPTLQELEKSPYSWFMTWHTEYLTDNNSPDSINELYNSDYVITLDEINFTQ